MTNKDWFVKEIRLTADARKYGVNRVQYPYHLVGELSANCHGGPFSWFVPRASLEDPRYDLSGVTLDERLTEN